MKRWFVFLFTGLLMIGSTLGSFALAAEKVDNNTVCNGEPKAVQCPDDPTKQCIPLCNPLNRGTTNINEILGIIIRAALGIVGSLTLLMLVFGGFKWLTSAGNPEKVKEGTQTILWAAIGVFLVFSSYFILSNFTDYLSGRK
jgi:hypothetical protein